MRRTMRHLIVGATASLFIAGCGITAAKKNEDKNNSDDASGIKAGASVNNQQFSLSLPYLPDVKPSADLKAHIRIFDSHVPMPDSSVDCPTNGHAVSVDVTMSDKPVSSGEVAPPTSAEKPVKKNGLALTQRPAKAVYDNSMEYKTGAAIGPIMLNPGLFTATLDVYDERGKIYTGVSWFEVKKDAVSYADMKMERVNDCGGGSGVVINPIIPGEPNDFVSACEFETAEIALCERSSAACYYQDFKAYSECGLSQARQQLISALCQKDIKIPKNFTDEIVCEVSTPPPPPPSQPKPQPKPAPTKPQPSPKPKA